MARRRAEAIRQAPTAFICVTLKRAGGRGGYGLRLAPCPVPLFLKSTMEQLSINWQEAAIQPSQLARCKAVIAPIIQAFWRDRGIGAQFHMDELTRFVNSHVTIAPDSAGRILRDMRQAKELNYSVVSRRKSLYQIEPLQL